MNTRQLNIVWLVLLVATAMTLGIGEFGEANGLSGRFAMAALLVISFVKGRLVVLDFMGLRGVKFFWRALLLGWLLVVSGLIALAYWIASK